MTTAERAACIERIANLPGLLTALVLPLDSHALLARPLADEWSVAQNVHHVADSHMNAYIRTRLILTEENPTVKPYFQERWAELADASSPDIGMSLELLAGLHARWVKLFVSLPDEAFARSGYHPEGQREITVDNLLSDYADHGEGHLDQVQRTLAAQLRN